MTVVFVGLDASKATLAVSGADDGRDGEIRDWGTISTAPSSVERFLKKLAARFQRVEICYEAGPTGYGLYRQITAFGFTCYVIAPSLIPVRPGERIKTDRRDAERLARFLRAGELTPIWVPGETHEAMRDLVRARDSAAQDQRHKRQLVSAFLLRHGRIHHRPPEDWPKTGRCATGVGCSDNPLIILRSRSPCKRWFWLNVMP